MSVADSVITVDTIRSLLYQLIVRDLNNKGWHAENQSILEYPRILSFHQSRRRTFPNRNPATNEFSKPMAVPNEFDPPPPSWEPLEVSVVRANVECWKSPVHPFSLFYSSEKLRSLNVFYDGIEKFAPHLKLSEAFHDVFGESDISEASGYGKNDLRNIFQDPYETSGNGKNGLKDLLKVGGVEVRVWKTDTMSHAYGLAKDPLECRYFFQIAMNYVFDAPKVYAALNKF